MLKGQNGESMPILLYSWHIEVHVELLVNEVLVALQETDLGNSYNKINLALLW